MRNRLTPAALFFCAAASPGLFAADPLEVSTGFLIGPRFDARLFYVKPSHSSAWQKSYAGPDFRKQAQGRLLGITLDRIETPVSLLKASGLNLARLHLQTPERSIFLTDGRLDPALLSGFARLLDQTADAGIALELVLFHPNRDELFDTPDAIIDSARTLTDWLIEHNYRHVLLNPAHLWRSPGWDFDHFVPQNLDRIAQAIRERFQLRRVDYALPIVFSVPVSVEANPAFAEQADVLIASGEGARIDPRRLERPVLIEHENPRDCAASFLRFAGCLASGRATGDSLAQLVLRDSR